MTNNQKGILYAVVTAFFWGFLAIFLKIAVQQVAPQTIVWFRFAIAFVLLAGWQLAHQPQSMRILARPPWLLVFAAMALSWNYLGFMLGIHYTTPSNAQLIIQTGPILLALASVILFKEKIRKLQLVGFIIAAVGFVFFYSQQIKLMIGQESEYNLGILLTLSGAMAWSVYAILQKRLVLSHSTASLNLFLFGFPALIYLPFVDFAPLLQLSWIWWGILIFLGINTLIAYGSLAQALKYTEANKVSIIIILNPMITFIVMGILTKMEVTWIEGEQFSLLSLLGAIIILCGAVLVVGRKKRTSVSKR
ncbi:DMT family transporter [uncultured Sunxiuqinia sp.]|uniref:DMT family transporter n=1 Tax=uncultured Sunxiuqinia sp. TaxID=1573825 RepID=UPI0026238747|nr:DMT family transporter [uncultured Sunxiuqinia sp.]